MKRERLPIPDDLNQLRLDLMPLYDLPLIECHRIILELTNLLAVAGYHLETTGNPMLAQAILIEAAAVLEDFDEDVAEFISNALKKDPTPSAAAIPTTLQEIITTLATEHGLDLETKHSSLQIHSEQPGVLTISVLGFEELAVAIFVEGEYGSLIPTPGILFQVGADEWRVLEIHQIRSPLSEITDEQIVALNRMPLPDNEAIQVFLEQFAQVILNGWVTVPHSAKLETNTLSLADTDTEHTEDLPF